MKAMPSLPSVTEPPSITPRLIPSAEAFQACLLESLEQKLPLVGGFPPHVSQLSLYAFTALNWRGLVVSVCLDEAQLELNMDILRLSGFEEPEVTLLHEGLMPHQQRAVYENLNQNRVKLLLTTPESFASVRFLAALARLPLTLLVVEDAQNLVPGFKAAGRYRPVVNAIQRMDPLPPLCLLTGPMGPRWHWQILDALGAEGGLFCQYAPPEGSSLASIRFQVHPCLTRHQQFSQLGYWVSQDSGSVLVRADDNSTAFRLGAALDQLGITPVWLDPFARLVPPGMEPPDPRIVRQARKTSPQSALVSVGYPTRFWGANPNTPHTVLWWELPTHLGDVLWDALSVPAAKTATQASMTLHLCYSKDGLADSWQRMQRDTRYQNQQLPRSSSEGSSANASVSYRQGVQQALEAVRDWYFSEESCRLVSLARFMDWPLTFSNPSQLTCGQCDVCQQQQHGPVGFLARILGALPTPARSYLRRLLYS